MAAPVYATDLTDIVVDMAATTGWTALGGGAAGLVAPETDFFIQGSNCISKAGWGTAVKGMLYNNGAAYTVPTTGAIVLWGYYWAPNAMDTSSSGGMRLVSGSGTGAYYEFTVAGSDKLPFAGWFLACVDPNTATSDFTVGSPTATEQYVGMTIDVPAGGPSKGQPLGIDAIRYGRMTLTYTNGDSGSGYATFSGASTYSDDVTRRWGSLSYDKGAYYMSGFHSLGSSGTAVDFRDSNRIIFIRDHVKVASGFNRIEVLNASSNVDWDNIQITALGTQSPGTFVHTAGSFDAINCQFTGMSTFSFLDAATATYCTFRNCGQITAPGADLNHSIVTGYTGAADTSAVVWDVNQDPDGELNNMTFIKGTNAHHAIELGTTSPTTVTLRNITFTGFNAANAANDSVIHVKRTTGSVTINAVSCSGTVSYKTAGATVTVVVDPVTIAIHVQDINTTTAISGARVWLPVTSTAGGKPYLGSVTITKSGTTATVTHTTHGMATNDYVNIVGATDPLYNGTFQITVTGTSAYTYTMTGTPSANATGTITSTFVVINGTTDASGDISSSYSWAASQPVSGRVRKATGTYYKTAPISGTINSTSGFSATIQMIPDS